MTARNGQAGIVYVIRCSFGVKIGYTRQLAKRLDTLRKKMDFEFIEAIISKNAFGLETFLHRRFKSKRMVAWQTSEIFKLNEDDMNYIAKLSEFEGSALVHCTNYWTELDPTCFVIKEANQ